jgi:hypothetical protein
MQQRFQTKLFRMAFVLSLLVLLTSCATVGQEMKQESSGSSSSSASKESARDEVKGTLLIFTEREPGSESYTSRVFVSKKYMHISDSYAPADFILFNRAEKTIYNVTRDDKLIFVIRNKPQHIKPPIEINLREESEPSAAIPKVDGRQASHYRFFVNGKRCYDSVVLGEDFMPDVLAAMREFRTVLANEHATTVNNIPKNMLDACDLSINVFNPIKHMEHGLPIREWDTRGFQRFLKDYREGVSVPASAFELPKDYRQYTAKDVPSMIRGSQ